MEMLPLAFTSGWASGLNAYATVLVLGLLGRFLGVDQVPAGLERTDVLVVAGVLALVEFFADKIPYVDSLWDAVSTVVRPVAGAAIGALMAGAQGDVWTVTLASVGGLTALVSHLVKASLRLAVNTSPEPASNIAVSLGEDTAAVGLTSLALLFPVPAAVVAGVLLLVGVVVAVLLVRRTRRGWQALQRWRDARR
ncbi:DUF4126 domain-containing protein [Auraticoccus monumenti]|uniref:DUF4126 domain-containing protein n=1 Tax=Auraticoccus monumenti TaxID=675864 RepID=A0A1G7DRP2_9ACTN|nr:DUF4126 domain-containing protein [Auraticoccus monumenti]SDE53525.1 protein of unknown function [Auraticoccus monumenti]